MKMRFLLWQSASRLPPLSIARSFTRHVKKKIGDADSCIVLAESDGCVVGYVSAYVHATLYADKPVAWIDEIFVSEDARNLGIGRGLMAEIDRWARGRGCRLVALASREAGEFYKALGYSEDVSRYYKRDPSG